MSTKGYSVIEFSDKVGWDSSARDWARALINTLEDSSIRILDYYETKNFCDFRVNQHGDIITYRVRPGGQVTIRMHEANSLMNEFKLYEEFKEYENLWDFLDENLLEAKTGIPYKGYIICYGCHDTDRWYIKNSYDKFIGTKSGYSSEEEAREFIDSMDREQN